jgi:hypothetical protein
MNKRFIWVATINLCGLVGYATSSAQPVGNDAPAPGTEASLRRYIDALEKGQPNYDDMSPSLAAAVRQQLPKIHRVIQNVGAFKSLTFKGVGTDGWDVYDATFANGELEWHVKPLAADGKVEGRRFNILAETPPAPDTESSQ